MSKSPSLRRIQADIRELALEPSDQYFAAPLENDMFEWHFTIRGAEGTEFEGGIYHGRILLPAEYPFKPPHIMFLTPSGRFETNTKICLSFSAYHPELWQPAWGIRLILEALISFLPTPGDGAIGALDWSSEERKRLATESQKFVCSHCGPISKLIPKLDAEKKKRMAENNKNKPNPFAKEIAKLQRLQQQNESRNKSKSEEIFDNNNDKTIDTTVEFVADGQTVTDGDLNSEVGDTATSTRPQSLSSFAEPAAAKVESDSGTGHESNDEVKIPPDDTMKTNDDKKKTKTTVDDAGDEFRNNVAKLYDPLLNISILLMFTICVLFSKKVYDLFMELRELQEIPIVEAITNTVASASVTTNAAAASSSSTSEL